MITFEQLREKTLTPAENKKREEIAKAMERENPGMPMAKKMAIATATAKKVAEANDTQMGTITVKTDAERQKRAQMYRDKKAKEESVEEARGVPRGRWGIEAIGKKTSSGQKPDYHYKSGMTEPEARKHHAKLSSSGKYAKIRIWDRSIGGKSHETHHEEAKPDAVEVMRKKQQMAAISTSDKDKLANIRAMLNKEKKPD